MKSIPCFVSFLTPDWAPSLLDQACQNPNGRDLALSLAQHLSPGAQAVADFLQWHVTGIAPDRICLTGSRCPQGTRWTVRLEGSTKTLARVKEWAQHQAHGHPIEEWTLSGAA